MEEDFHIISSNGEEKKKKKSPFFISISVIVVLLLAGVIIGNITLLQKQQVEGTHTENTEGSIRFDTPQTTSPPDNSTPITNSPTPSPKGSRIQNATKTIILKSMSSEDGFVDSAGLIGINTAIKIGDDGTDTFRGFVSFNLDDLPQGTTISKATVRIYQTKLVGNPFGVHGAIKVDHLVYGTALNSDAYNTIGQKDKFATIPQSTSAGWKEIDVTNQLKNDTSDAHTRSQYRIHFDQEKVSSSNSENMVYFESASNSLDSG